MKKTGKITAICISEQKGTQKHRIEKAELRENHGIVGDAHAGNWHRQVSLLSQEKVDAFRARGAKVDDGAFGENILATGFDFRTLPVGTRFSCGEILLEMTQIGKECHSHCAIFKAMGDCIMPREGVFCRVLRGGTMQVGDELVQLPPAYRVAILVSSDKGARGEREDLSGPAIREIAEAHGLQVVSYSILPDEQEQLSQELARICDEDAADLILTSGGTGFSPRDCMPEATAAVTERQVPGITEAMRIHSLQYSSRSMLSRAAAGIRKRTLIVNLPGSPKAVRENLEYAIDALIHGLEMLRGSGSADCARS